MKRDLKKAIMMPTIGVPGTVLEKFKIAKDAGFEGVEPMSHQKMEDILEAQQATGLHIPSLCCNTHGAKPLSSPDPAVRAEGVAGLQQALREAKKLGASSVLFVPGFVNKEVAYQDAWTRSLAELKKAVPAAEELGVRIALENIWSQFLISPLEMARFIDELGSPMVGAQFDTGNVLRYGWPEHWIPVLGQRIVKVHIKEFSRKKMNEVGLYKGADVVLMEGDVNWPVVMKALDDVGYKGWAISEQGGGLTPEKIKDIADRMDKIFAL